MATQAQTSYISDLAVIKTKEFKEVKELIVAHNIASGSSQTVAGAGTIAEICNALTDQQASQLIDVLVMAKPPQRATTYAQTRVKKTIDLLDGIKSAVNDWTFI